MKNLSIWITVGVVALVLLIVVSMYFSTSNTEISLRNKIEATQTSCTAYYDKMWKIISQKAQVSSQYKESFNDIYKNIMSERYDDKGGSLMKWIQESNPNFDVSLYRDLSASIESERQGFLVEQKSLIDLNLQHRNLLMKFPSTLFVGSRPPIDIKIITSATTEDVYKTRQENNVKVF